MATSEQIRQIEAQIGTIDTATLKTRLSSVDRLARRPATRQEKADAADPEKRTEMQTMAYLIRAELARRQPHSPE